MPIVDYLGTCRFHLNCRTALGVRRHLKKKPIKAKSNGYLISVHGHAHALYTPWSALCCLLFSSAVSIASRLPGALAAKLLLQTITKELTLQCATCQGFCKICSLTLGACASVMVLGLSFAVHRAAEISDHFYALAGKVMT